LLQFILSELYNSTAKNEFNNFVGAKIMRLVRINVPQGLNILAIIAASLATYVSLGATNSRLPDGESN